MKAVVAAFNQEKALVGAFFVIVQLHRLIVYSTTTNPWQVPDVDAIVIPVGGGGLIAGVALAVKTMKPDVLIIGVEPEVTRHQGHSSGHRVTLSPLQACPSFKTALEVGRAVQVPTQASLADGNTIYTHADTIYTHADM